MERELNEGQKQAVYHGEGPMMALAGPGSGKTFTITRRIEYLIKEKQIPPGEILVITFTRAAAEEMKQRFLKRMPNGGRVVFGTFHAVFFTVLKHAYHFQPQNIISEQEKIRCMREIIHAMHVDYEDEQELIQGLLEEISLIKNNRMDVSHYYSVHCGRDVFVHVYKKYHEILKRSHKIDFDDMLVYTYELFRERKDILSAWQKKYPYILIDEFQDVNQLQYDIIRMLAAPLNNLFVVGDDDQSIYRFRGAKPEIMLHMPKDYENLEIVKLKYNYRCPEEIVHFASNLIAHNNQRFQKEIQGVKCREHSISFREFDSIKDENENLMKHLKNQKTPFCETAVLFRTNIQARPLMEKLLEYNIPFTAKDKAPNIYEHWIAKDLCAYMRIAMGGRNRRDFLLVMNRPKRYLSRESLEAETVSFDSWLSFYSEQPWIADRIDKLWQDLKTIAAMRPFAAVNYIRKGVGYDDFLKEYADYRNIKEEELFEVLEELQESTRGFLTFEDWFSHIEEYGREIERVWEMGKGKKEGITLSTFHSAKGLEFDSVHIMEVNEGVTPYKKAALPQEIEEERRMFYVAVTRARRELFLYSVKNINNHKGERSRFLQEGGIEETLS